MWNDMTSERLSDKFSANNDARDIIACNDILRFFVKHQIVNPIGARQSRKHMSMHVV